MRSFFIAMSFLYSITSYANSTCPNLGGKYSSGRVSVWASETIYEITQISCQKLKLTKVIRESGRVIPSVVVDLTIDGARHMEEGPGIFWQNTWEKNGLTREPWSAPSGGELLGFRTHWYVAQESNGMALVIQTIDDNGELLSEEKFLKQ